MIFSKDSVFLNLVKGEREHKNYGVTHTIRHIFVNEDEKKLLLNSYKYDCRSCGNLKLKRVVSLGYQPLANNLLKKKDEKCELYPLEVNYCDQCHNCQLSIVVNPKKMFSNYLYTSSTTKTSRNHFVKAANKYIKDFKLTVKKSYIIDIGSNDGIALKPFKDLKFKKILGIEPAKNLARLASKNGTIVIEVQYLLNTLRDLTFDNIYHEHYNYWSLTSLINFFNQFNAKIFRAEKIDTHGGSLRIYIKKNKKIKIENNVKKLINEEEIFGIKDFKTYQKFGEKVYQIKENIIKNIAKLKKKSKIIIGYGAPAKATTALNFFGISKEIDFIVEDNKLKHNKFIPGVKISIKSKSSIKSKNHTLLILAWNFFNEIKKNNSDISNNFVNIKDLED
jgi:hypothetical protein